MSTIRPTTSTPSLPNSPSAAHVATVQGSPPVLGRIAVGQIIEATIISQTAPNTFQVRTPLGKFLLHSALHLPKGSTLILQLSSQSPFMQFQINSLNGKTPSSQTKTDDIIQTKSKQEKWSPSTKLAVGKVLLATMVGHFSEPPGKLTQGPKESSISTVKNAETPIEGKNSIIQKLSPTEDKSLRPSTTNEHKISNVFRELRELRGLQNLKNTTASTLKTPEQLLIGSKLSVKVMAVQQPDPTSARATPTLFTNKNSIPTLSIGNKLRGIVSGTTTTGQPIIQTEAGIFTFNTQTNIPQGSTITIEVASAPIKPINEMQVAPFFYEGIYRSKKWPALEQALQTLEEVQPRTTQKLINSIIPRPGTALISNIIFFLSALKVGDLQTWIGEKTLRLIERHQPNIASRIKEDFMNLTRMVEEPQPGDWRIALVPINSNDGIHQIRLLLRKNDEETDKEDATHSRFIIDVQLSRIGRLQLDGLVRDEGNFLELIIRSDTHLADNIQNKIRTIFTEATIESGIKGGINFQAAPANFIDIPDPENNHNVGLLV